MGLWHHTLNSYSPKDVKISQMNNKYEMTLKLPLPEILLDQIIHYLIKEYSGQILT